jgi:hypothetical protein
MGSNTSSGTTILTISFDEAVLGAGLFTIDYFGPNPTTTMTLAAYDGINGTGTLLGSGTSVVENLQPTNLYFMGVTDPDNVIRSVVFSHTNTTGDTIGIDDIRIGTRDVVLDILIDIKPGTEGNFINENTADKIAVALLGEEDFDVLDVDLSTLAFGPAAAAPFLWAGVTVDDIDSDDFDDLVVHFRLEESGIQLGQTQACVTGELLDGATIQGCDAIAVVACGLGFELAFLLPPLAWLRARRSPRLAVEKREARA